MKTRSKVYIHYNPELTIKEIAQDAGVTETAVKNFISKNGLGSKHQQNFFIKLRKVETAIDKLSKFEKVITNNTIAELTGLSSKTVAKYRKIIDEKTEKRLTKKVAYFSTSNSKVIKSVSNDQSQILMWALKLYSPRKKIDFDLNYSTGGFYRGGIPQPTYKFDKYPLSQAVNSLDQAEKLALTQPNSLFFGVVDPPHIISTGDSVGVNGISNIDGSNIISDRFSCFKNLEELQNSNEYLISLSSKLLAEGGILLYKIQDTISSGRQIFAHLFVIEKAKEYGLELEDIFLLTSQNRLLSPKHLNQKHARKYHSFILIFKRTVLSIRSKESTSQNHLPLGTIRTFEYKNVISFCEVGKQWGELSNMSNAFPVEYKGIIYPTSEHLYIAGRFLEHRSICMDIAAHPNAMYCKRKYRSKTYRPFVRSDWDEVNVEWMKFVLNLKYEQNPEFRRLLKATGDKIILEDSTTHMGTNPYSGHSSFFWGAKDLERRKVIHTARVALRKRMKTEGGFSDSQIKKQCKELKNSVYDSHRSHFIGANIMGLLLTKLRDEGVLRSDFPLYKPV